MASRICTSTSRMPHRQVFDARRCSSFFCTFVALPFCRLASQTRSSVPWKQAVRMCAAAAPALPDIDEKLERFEWERMNLPDLSGKTAMVTGGNSGLGFAIALALAKQNAHVILTARNKEKGKDAVEAINASLKTDKVELMELDLASSDKIRSFVKDWRSKSQPLHILINNAGIHIPGAESRSAEKSGEHTAEGFEVTLATNYFGPFLLTQLLLEDLKKSAPSRVVNQGSGEEAISGGIPWEDLKGRNKETSDAQVYGLSKLMNVMWAKALNEKLKGTGVEAFSAHPGVSDTEIFEKTDDENPVGFVMRRLKNLIGQSAERGASPILYAAASPDVEGKGGAFIGGPVGALAIFSNFDQFKDRDTWSSEGKHLEDCMRLYEETMKLVSPGMKGL